MCECIFVVEVKQIHTSSFRFSSPVPVFQLTRVHTCNRERTSRRLVRYKKRISKRVK